MVRLIVETCETGRSDHIRSSQSVVENVKRAEFKKGTIKPTSNFQLECLRPLELGGAKQDSFGELGVGGKYLIERQREDVSLGFVCRAEEQKVLRCLCGNLALVDQSYLSAPHVPREENDRGAAVQV